MSFISIATALGEIFPIIYKWLSSDPEPQKAAEKIVEIGQDITECKDPQQLIHVLRESPEKVEIVQEALFYAYENQERLWFEDRQNARQRDISLAHAGRRGNRRADIMVVAAALGLMACLITLTCFGLSLPGEAVGILSTIAGIFGSCLKDAYMFEFGSSRGSRDKDAHVAAMIDKIYPD